MEKFLPATTVEPIPIFRLNVGKREMQGRNLEPMQLMMMKMRSMRRTMRMMKRMKVMIVKKIEKVKPSSHSILTTVD